MIKVCFFDMDSTIYSHRINGIPKSCLKALKILQNKGIKIVLATGRHSSELEEMEGNDLPFDAYLLLNGNLCLNKNKEVVFKNTLHEIDEKILIDLFENNKIPLSFVEENRLYNNFINEHVVEAYKAISTPISPLEKYKGDKIIQAIAYYNDKKHLQSLLKHSSLSQWNEYGIDINALNAGKLEAIKRYLKQENISQNECMAFGDGENDIDMLKYAHIGVAMGNALKQVKEISDYVTKDIDEDGILHALLHYKIIEEKDL